MAEKADLPTDTVSLPPTYAPSEAYTESPPPAYRRPGMAAVRIARLVCCTLLAMTFIVGLFVISHKWIQSRSCDCQMQELDSLKSAALLSAPSFEINNNKIEEDINMKEVEAAMGDADDDDQDIVVPMDETKIPTDAGFEEKFEQLTNDLRLPKGLLVGNPKLAGKDVHCKVEKRQQKIAEGIISQAIIVTCDDNDDDDEDEDDDIEDDDTSDEHNENKLPFEIAPPRPPMSLFSSIMKILSSRPSVKDNEPEVRPKIIPVFRSPRQPIPFPFPMRPPFQGPNGPIMFPVHKIHMKVPIHHREEENSPMPFAFQRPPPEIIQGRSPRMNVLPPMKLLQRPIDSKIRLPFPIPNNLPIRIIRLPQPENEININENDDEIPPPIHPLLKLLPPTNRILHLRPMSGPDDMPNGPQRINIEKGPFPFHREEEEEHVPHPMPEASGRALPSPVAIPGLRVVRLPLMPRAHAFPEANLMTHMEVKAAENEENIPHQQLDEEEPIINDERPIEDNVEFGPPRIHTLINQEQPPITDIHKDVPEEKEPEFADEQPIVRPLPRFFPFPPPRFAPEGRVSEHAEINPDAEIISVDRPQQSIPESHRVVLN